MLVDVLADMGMAMNMGMDLDVLAFAATVPALFAVMLPPLRLPDMFPPPRLPDLLADALTIAKRIVTVEPARRIMKATVAKI